MRTEDTVVKVREAYYCNVKAFLLFLVILGHGIEPFTGRSKGLLQLYRIIYTFHMPLFALVTGIFLKTTDACKKQAFSGAAWYLLAQGMRLVCYGLAFLAGAAVFSFMPARRMYFSRWGTDTLPAYLIHGLGLSYMRMAAALTSHIFLCSFVYGILVLAVASAGRRRLGECYGIRCSVCYPRPS